jgi:ribosomal protein S24E
MEMKVIENRENKIFRRREILIEASYDEKTPSREAVKEAVCKKLNLDPDSTLIVKISQLSGSKKSSIKVQSYSDKEGMKSFEKKRGEKKVAGPKATATA